MIEIPDRILSINRTLCTLFGLNLSNKPNYRVSFSDNETEFRIGTFNEFYGKIFLREVTGPRLCKKYPYIKSRFIIEKLYKPELVQTKEILNHNGYEVFYVFEDKYGNYLEPIERVAITICRVSENPYDYWKRKNELEDIDKKQEQDEYDAVYYGIETTPVSLALSTGEAVIVSKEIKNDSE